MAGVLTFGKRTPPRTEGKIDVLGWFPGRSGHDTPARRWGRESDFWRDSVLKRETNLMKRSIRGAFGVAALCMILGGMTAQAQQPAALVIEGGTLIDGNGGVP